jgi:hypothetical protein
MNSQLQSTQNVNEDTYRLLKGLSEFQLKIIIVSDLNKFWVRVNEPEHLETMERIEFHLNNENNKLTRVNPKNIHVGLLVVGFHFSEPFKCGYYRAKILKVDWQSKSVDVIKLLNYNQGFFYEF